MTCPVGPCEWMRTLILSFPAASAAAMTFLEDTASPWPVEITIIMSKYETRRNTHLSKSIL